MNRPVHKGVAPSEVLDRLLNWPSQRAKEWALAEIPRLCGASTTCAIVLFGSVVRDVQTPTDLDVLYVYDSHPVDYRKPPIDVDLRTFDKVGVEEALRSGNDLLSWCIRYGEPVCEKDNYWSDLVALWKGKLGLPPASVALERAQKSERLLREMSSVGDDDAALEIYLAMLTQLARARLIERGIYPASRPELPKQLQAVGEGALASDLLDALKMRNALVHGLASPDKKIWQRFLQARDSKVKKKTRA